MASKASAGIVARRQIANSVFVAFCFVVTAIALGALALILWSLVSQGAAGLNLHIFTMDTPAAGSEGVITTTGFDRMGSTGCDGTAMGCAGAFV